MLNTIHIIKQPLLKGKDDLFLTLIAFASVPASISHFSGIISGNLLVISQVCDD